MCTFTNEVFLANEPILRHSENPRPIVLAGENFTFIVKAALEKGKGIRFCAKGYSMLPFIRGGDIITVFPLYRGYLKIGDTVAFACPANTIIKVHRIIKKHHDLEKYTIKGDNIFCADGIISRKDIIGYVKTVERSGRNIRLGLGSEKGAVALLSSLNIFRIVLFLWNMLPLNFKKKFKDII